MLYINTMKYYTAIKTNLKNAICSNIHEPGDYNTKGIKSDREGKHHTISLIWRIKKICINELIYKKKQIHRLKQWTYD